MRILGSNLVPLTIKAFTLLYTHDEFGKRSIILIDLDPLGA